MDVKRNYLLHIRLGRGQPALSRIGSAATLIQEIVKQMSNDEYQLAYTSHDAATFGFFLKTKLVAAQIRARIESPDDGSPFLNDDSMLVLELGPDFSGIGLTRSWTWLQHH